MKLYTNSDKEISGLYFLGILAFGVSIFIISMAEGAIHEIEAFIFVITTAIFLSGGAIVGSINKLKTEIKKSDVALPVPNNIVTSKGKRVRPPAIPQ